MSAPNMHPMMYPYYGTPVHPAYQQQQQQQFYQQQYPHPDSYYHQSQPHQPFHPNDEMLFQKVKAQIEFYFRPQNLENDSFLQAQLNSTEHLGAVPIHIVCSFPKVRELYTIARYGVNIPRHQMPLVDPNVLRIALRGSDVVVISEDGMWISPVLRSTPKLHPVAAAAVGPLPSDVNDSGDGTFAQDAASSIGQQDKDECTTTAKDAEAASTTTVNTGISSVQSTPSSPLSQSSSLGVPTHPLPPSLSKERNTLILRDIPDSATEVEVMEAFSSETIKPKSLRPDVGNTWYVTFESEEHAVTALSISSERTIAGAPIRGRLKGGGTRNNNLSIPPLPPTAILHPTQVVTDRVDHSISSSIVVSSTSAVQASFGQHSSNNNHTLSGSSYPLQSGSALNNTLFSQGYGYVVTPSYGMPQPRSHPPHHPIAYHMQQQQLFHQKDQHHHHNYQQHHHHQQQRSFQHHKQQQAALYPRRLPATQQTPQATAVSVGASHHTSLHPAAPGNSEHYLQQRRRPQQEQRHTSYWRLENQQDESSGHHGSETEIALYAQEHDSHASNKTQKQSSYQTEGDKFIKNNKKSKNNKNKQQHQNMKNNNNKASNNRQDSHTGNESLARETPVSGSYIISDANSNNHRNNKVDHPRQGSTSMNNNITDKNHRERTMNNTNIAGSGNSSFPGIGQKHPESNTNRSRTQYDRGNISNYNTNLNNNSTHKGKKNNNSRKTKTKEAGSIRPVELNAADFPALSLSTMTKVTTGQSAATTSNSSSSTKLVGGPSTTTPQRLGYAQAVLKIPPPSQAAADDVKEANNNNNGSSSSTTEPSTTAITVSDEDT